MAYTPTDWTDGVTPVNAALMDKIEQGIDNIDSRLTTIETVPQGAELTYEGDYVPATEYEDGDVAVKDGVAYMCVGGPTTEAPDPDPWGAAMAAGGVPVGATMCWFTPTPPPGWLILAGQVLSRTTYAALFALWGTTYGAGDGSTTFGLPDCQGRMPVGVGSHADVNALGKNDTVSVGFRTPKHRHSVNDPAHVHGVSDPTHAHSIADPGHSHLVGSGVGGGGYAVLGRSAATDIDGWYGGWIYGAGTGIGIYGAATGITVSGAATGITVGPAGTLLDTPPFIAVNWIVKV